jgi:hypothetical protein
MKMQVETFAKSSDAPAQTSPELVLVSPPEEAQAAREALTEPQPETAPVANQAPRSVALRQVVAPEERLVAVPPPKPPPASFAPPLPPAPAVPARRRRSRMLLLAFALVLAAGGFVVGRQLGERHRPGAAAAVPATAQSVSQPAATTGRAQSAGARTHSTSAAAGPQSTSPPRGAPAPAVSWKAQPGVRHYRLDVVRGGAVVLTILTDEPRASIPLTFPNAGRRSRLAPGTYQWRVSAATARPSRVLSHGTVKVH